MLFCACSWCHLCRVFGSFFLLMNWWIISFTPCPFALVCATFSNSGLVCVMSEPSHLQLCWQWLLVADEAWWVHAAGRKPSVIPKVGFNPTVCEAVYLKYMDDVHIEFSTMDAKVNDTKILIKKLVLDPNMNRGLAMGVAVAAAAAAVHPHPPNPSRQPRAGAASQRQSVACNQDWRSTRWLAPRMT